MKEYWRHCDSKAKNILPMICYEIVDILQMKINVNPMQQSTSHSINTNYNQYAESTKAIVA